VKHGNRCCCCCCQCYCCYG